jgi:predicted RNA-binding Zn-ribbon protein involved in translation (DUF1610 family)
MRPKKICFAKPRDNRPCAGVMEEVPRYFCPRCLEFGKTLKLYNPKVKLECPDCGRNMIGSITYICKKCKSTANVIEIK